MSPQAAAMLWFAAHQQTRMRALMKFAMTYRIAFSSLSLLGLFYVSAQAQNSPPALQTEAITDNIQVISGAGGNIAVFSGADGVFVIDNGMPNVIEPVAAAIKAVNAEPVRMIFNTHWHFDHAGGNEYYGNEGAIIVAHDNVRKRMSVNGFSKLMNAETEASPYAALPVVTFDSTTTFHLNGDTVTATHVPAAHTDGDAVLRFENANVVHMGDLFFNGLYPVIDVSAGGSIEGMIAAVDKIMPTLNESTTIIPGHGPVATVEDLRVFRAMLNTVARRVRVLIDEGKSIDEIIAKRPSITFDEKWAWNFMPPDRWITVVHDSMISAAEAASAADTE
jgi:cyclase